MSRYKLLILILCLFSTFEYFGQSKNEKESKVLRTDFPIAAQQLLSLTPDNAKRIKFYQETDGDKSSFECKFKLHHFWYSVEFDQEGTLEDIEVKVRKHQIQESIRTTINNYLDQNSDKYDIIKIQEQYVYDGTLPAIEFYKSTLSNRNSISSNYEIIVALKRNKSWTLNEMTFDINGRYIKSRELQTNSYEYIMH